MAQNAENIEAKLCAYVDGELDAQGRAEIEKHLQSNPQHRRLLEALRKTHQYVSQLPREKAPPEILENLQSQLERAVLLDDTGQDESDVVMRINRWPQITSIAAIVLLTVGLGVILYYMLPPLGGQPDTYSTIQDRPRSTEPAEPRRPDVPALSAAPRDQPSGAGVAPNGLMARNTEAVKAKEGEIDAIQEVKRRLSAAARQEGAPAAEPQVLLVVNTDNPAITQRQLLAYLQSNQIQWNPIRESVPTTLPGGSTAPQEQEFAQAAPSATAPAEQPLTTQPAVEAKLAPAQEDEPEDLIVCPNMSAQQANELAGALPMWRNGQRAVVVSYFGSSQAPAATQPATAPSPQTEAPLALSDQAATEPAERAVQATQPAEPRILHPGDRVQLQIALEADLELKKIMLIGDAGAIILPLAGEIQAAGLTEAQLADAIAEAYRVRNIAPQPQVHVLYLDPAAQPPPIAVAIYLQNDPAQPTTSPAEPTTAPAEGADALPPPPTTAP